jgi:undecaprenyl-diphosphatase
MITDLQMVVAINKFLLGTPLDAVTSLLGSPYFMPLLIAGLVAAVLLFDKKRRKVVVMALVFTICLHLLFTELLFKDLLFSKERPYQAHPDEIVAIGQPMTDSSFPSGHTSATVGLVVVLAFYYRRTWPFGLAFALFMGFSRIHNGMHYVADVWAGFVLGLVYGALALLLARLAARKAQSL